jgi:hypothetical protein
MHLTPFFALILSLACKAPPSKEKAEVSQTESDTSTEPEPTEEEEEEPADLGDLAIVLPESPEGVMSVIDKAVTSALSGEASSTVLVPGAGQIAIALNAAGESTTHCSAQGNPIHPDPTRNALVPGETEARLPREDVEYAVGKFNCLFTQNTLTIQSIQGAYTSVKEYLCLSKDALTLPDPGGFPVILLFSSRDQKWLNF